MVKRLTDWRYIGGMMIAPLVAALFLWGVYQVQRATRYNPAYFTEEYRLRYATPGDLITDLEAAINTGDAAKMAALRGTRLIPAGMTPLPNVKFSIFWSAEGKYLDYLFADTVNYKRYMQHFTQVRGRYVVVPDGVFYYFDSGRWRTVLLTTAMVWWSAVVVLVAGAWLFQAFARVRRETFSPKPKDRNGLKDE